MHTLSESWNVHEGDNTIMSTSLETNMNDHNTAILALQALAEIETREIVALQALAEVENKDNKKDTVPSEKQLEQSRCSSG